MADSILKPLIQKCKKLVKHIFPRVYYQTSNIYFNLKRSLNFPCLVFQYSNNGAYDSRNSFLFDNFLHFFKPCPPSLVMWEQDHLGSLCPPRKILVQSMVSKFWKRFKVQIHNLIFLWGEKNTSLRWQDILLTNGDLFFLSAQGVTEANKLTYFLFQMLLNYKKETFSAKNIPPPTSKPASLWPSACCILEHAHSWT